MLRGQQEAAMRKHVSFAIAATVLVSAIGLWTITGFSKRPPVPVGPRL
jgi:hypothetical protein